MFRQPGTGQYIWYMSKTLHFPMLNPHRLKSYTEREEKVNRGGGLAIAKKREQEPYQIAAGTSFLDQPQTTQGSPIDPPDLVLSLP